MTRDPSPVRWEAKLGLTPKGMLVGSKAEHRASDYSFQRTQSMVTRQLEWEKRESAIEPMWKSLIGGALIVVFMVAAFFLSGVIQ